MINLKLNIFKLNLILILISGWCVAWGANSELISESIQIDLTDPVPLQRGARIYMNYCSGCHGLKLMRYNSLAQGIGIVDESGDILTDVVEKYLIFSNDKITSPMTTALRIEDGQNWFGIAPPDLSLVARSRGPNWLYAYLRSFYRDPMRPWGVNNLIYPDVAMPHVLWQLQGIQELPKTEFLGA